VLTLATNACATDDLRVRLVIPSWIRTFGERLDEIVVVLDEQVPRGRQADQHGAVPALERVRDELASVAAKHSLVRVVPLRPGEATERALGRWFGGARPWRCQGGSTIVGYVLALEAARNDLVLKLDCDMVFREGGWLEQGRRLLERGELDAAEPPRLGFDPACEAAEFSSRAFLLSRARFARRLLPMRARRLDWPRRIHRRLQGRPTWLPLEQMLEAERREGRLRWRILDATGGFALHLPRRADAELPWIESVIRSVEAGRVPAAQAESGCNFRPALWPEAARAPQRAEPLGSHPS
jgi:hypothetical protein